MRAFRRPCSYELPRTSSAASKKDPLWNSLAIRLSEVSGLATRAGCRLVRDVGQPLECVVDRERRTDNDDRDRAEQAERNAGEVHDGADGEAGPCLPRRLPIHIRRQ